MVQKTLKERNENDLKLLMSQCDEKRAEQFRKYVQSYIVNGMRPATVCGQIQSLSFWNKMLSKPFLDLTKDELNAAFMALESFTFTGKNGKVREYSLITKNTRKIHLRKFLNFIGREDLTTGIKVRRSRGSKLPEDLITRDEVHKMIDACMNLRDKALVSLIYESGARSGELLSLRIKNIEKHEKGYYVHFPTGKTGARKILVIYSAKHLFNWLQAHPLKEDRNAPLWVVLDKRHEEFNHEAMHTRLFAIAKRAGITKKVNPHAFRHAQATELAKDFTEQQMKRYLGWTADSSMASVYVHLSGRDIDDAVLKKNGIKIEDRNTSLRPNECPKCHFISEGNFKYCGVCGTILTVETQITDDEKFKNALMALLTSPDEELIKKFREKLG
ncbi:site-specific integrase [uncultured Methanomethylovorans sp.]|uniref:site-specific integrase n=1 Tax=uncultured Methanomethylovorans sp. TaxID=183759 RepID=UPI002AA80AF9|nr:site-specific integrase [uncultured Methanomethylovorans sp.]